MFLLNCLIIVGELSELLGHCWCVFTKTCDYCKMEEVVVETSEPQVQKTKPAEPIIAEAIPAPAEPTTAEPKKKGRPAGAKDKAPRKKTKIAIIEEPLCAPTPEPEPVEEPKPRAKPAPKARQQADPLPKLHVSFDEPPVEEPPSPRTIMRSASINILQLRELTEKAKKTHLQDMYTRKLHRL